MPVKGRALALSIMLGGCAGWSDESLDLEVPDALHEPLPDFLPLAERDPPGDADEGERDEPRARGGHVSFAPRRKGRTCTLSSPRVVIRPYLDRETVRRTITRHRNDLRACYNRALRHDRTLTGRVVLSFLIEHGNVTNTSIDAFDPAFESCLTQAVRRWTFPSPDGAGRVLVHYPVVFSIPIATLGTLSRSPTSEGVGSGGEVTRASGGGAELHQQRREDGGRPHEDVDSQAGGHADL